MLKAANRSIGLRPRLDGRAHAVALHVPQRLKSSPHDIGSLWSLSDSGRAESLRRLFHSSGAVSRQEDDRRAVPVA
jgi:hypothetical protein